MNLLKGEKRMKKESINKPTVLPNSHIKREQCAEGCKGCNKMFSDENIGDVCISYVDPKERFRLGECYLKSNKEIESGDKKKINPLKLNKRKYRRR